MRFNRLFRKKEVNSKEMSFLENVSFSLFEPLSEPCFVEVTSFVAKTGPLSVVSFRVTVLFDVVPVLSIFVVDLKSYSRDNKFIHKQLLLLLSKKQHETDQMLLPKNRFCEPCFDMR